MNMGQILRRASGATGPRGLVINAAATVVALGIASVASATVTPQWVPVPISAAAIAADPTLANFRTYDLKVTQTGGEHWVGADLEVQLTSGKFYVPPANNQLWAKSNLWAASPNLEFDTFVTSPDSLANPSPQDGTPAGGHILILGQGSYPVPGQPGGSPVMPDATNSKDQINISYGDLYSNQTAFGDGTYTVARLTMSNDAGADIGGRVTGNQTFNGNSINTYYYPQLFHVAPVPEPTTLGALAVVFGLITALRRRS